MVAVPGVPPAQATRLKRDTTTVSPNRIFRSLPLVAIMAAALINGPNNANAAEPEPKRGGTLIFAVDAEPSNYDCHANVSFAFLHPVAPHYSTLLKFDTAHYPRIVGDLAESWTVSPDKLTYSFKLRPGVLFHDGTLLTSEDVKASYQRIAHPPQGIISARQVDYASIGAIDTPTPLSLVFSSPVAGRGNAACIRLAVELHL